MVKKATVKEKQIIRERAYYCCEYCHAPENIATHSFSIEHIQPLSKNGKTQLDNLAFSCQGCNSHKYNKTNGYDSVTGKVVPLFNPRKQLWYNHFKWSSDFFLIIGITPTGRVTTDILKLNRSGLINLRKMLYAAGEHPSI